MPDFTPGQTPVTQSQFDYYQGKQWKTSQVIGVNLDVLIIKNLFGI
jgi:hypothetical protein